MTQPATQLAPAAPGRMVWLDALRLMAGVSMVVLHGTSDPGGGPWADWPVEDRIAPIALRAIVYSARTELFLMISLFLLILSLDRRPRGYGAVIGEQARRLVIPFLFWTAVFAAFNGVKASAFGYTEGWIADLASPREWARVLFLGEVKYHMHFLPTLFGLVLAYPLFRAAFARPWLAVIVLGCLLAKREIDALVWSTLWGSDLLPWAVRGVRLLTYVGYGMVAGAFAALWVSPSRLAELRALLPMLLYTLAVLLVIKAGGAVLTLERGAWPWDYTAGYWADFLMPIGLFALCLALSHRRWPTILSTLAPYSFGLYLCHPIFMDLAEIAMRDWTAAPIVQVLCKVGGAIVASSGLVLALSRFRPLAWTVGLGPLPWVRRRSPTGPPGPRSPRPNLTAPPTAAREP